MAGKSQVVGGSAKTKVQVVAAKLLSHRARNDRARGGMKEGPVRVARN